MEEHYSSGQQTESVSNLSFTGIFHTLPSLITPQHGTPSMHALTEIPAGKPCKTTSADSWNTQGSPSQFQSSSRELEPPR